VNSQFETAQRLAEELTWARGLWGADDFPDWDGFTERWLRILSQYMERLTVEQRLEIEQLQGTGGRKAAAKLFALSPQVLAHEIGPDLELPAKLGSAEMEWAAAVYILLCAESPCRWRPVRPAEIGAFVSRRSSQRGIYEFPGFKLDFNGLSNKQLMRWWPAGSSVSRIWMTPRGLRLCAQALGIE